MSLRCQQEASQPTSVTLPPPHDHKEMFPSQEQAEVQQPGLLLQHLAKRGSVEILHNFQLSYSIVFPRDQACLVNATRALK